MPCGRLPLPPQGSFHSLPKPEACRVGHCVLGSLALWTPVRVGLALWLLTGRGWDGKARPQVAAGAGLCQWRGWWGNSWILETPHVFPPFLPCGGSTLSQHPEVRVQGPSAERGPWDQVDWQRDSGIRVEGNVNPQGLFGYWNPSPGPEPHREARRPGGATASALQAGLPANARAGPCGR